jgi:nucleoside-diphosphate-sugar epimerase
VDGPPDGFGTYVHSPDMARAYRLALEHPRPGCEAYHFAANDVMTRQPIRDRLRQHWPDCPPLPDDWPAFKSPVLTGKAKAHFAWEPQFSLRDQYTRRRGRKPQAWV